MGVTDPETRQRQKRERERQGAERRGDRGSGREARQQDPQAEERAQWEAVSAKDSNETIDTDSWKRHGEQGGGPGPEKWGARRTRRDSDSDSGQI